MLKSEAVAIFYEIVYCYRNAKKLHYNRSSMNAMLFTLVRSLSQSLSGRTLFFTCQMKMNVEVAHIIAIETQRSCATIEAA